MDHPACLGGNAICVWTHQESRFVGGQSVQSFNDSMPSRTCDHLRCDWAYRKTLHLYIRVYQLSIIRPVTLCNSLQESWLISRCLFCLLHLHVHPLFSGGFGIPKKEIHGGICREPVEVGKASIKTTHEDTRRVVSDGPHAILIDNNP